MTVDFLDDDESLEGYARTVARAFVDYPFMFRVFKDTPGSKEDWIYELAIRSAKARHASGGRTLVVRADGKIVAGANVAVPISPGMEVSPAWFEEFLHEAGPTAHDFFTRFIAVVESVELPQPNVYLVMIGVDPNFQGQGVGKMLIEKVMDMAREVPDCKGVGLDTEDEVNVRIYERCGFKVTAERQIDDLPVYVMWRSME
ncbi:MAG: GNAT family N-acetyltransferase [Chlorobia bacterium]|nr:GNAT family N-acetyltransferase [Fimbriimonadaceae bacterium]